MYAYFGLNTSHSSAVITNTYTHYGLSSMLLSVSCETQNCLILMQVQSIYICVVSLNFCYSIQQTTA